MAFRRRTASATRGPEQRHSAGRGGRRGGPNDRNHERSNLKPAPALPNSLYGIIEHMGAKTYVRLLNRELSRMTCVVDDNTLPLGEIVRVKLGPPQQKFGAVEVTILEQLGKNPAGIESLIAIINAGMPTEFPAHITAEAEALPTYIYNENDKRADWRALPFVTIDGADARDFDDAVQAEVDGVHLLLRVAIADVAHYVKTGTELDLDARERGNSTYFPDRVVPMLPEHLSNDLCSLRPKVDRPVLGVEITLDEYGVIKKHRFMRAVICSHARLTYDQVNAALVDNLPDSTTKPLMPALNNLLAVYKALEAHKTRRGALDLNIPESMIVMNKQGEVTGVAPRPRLLSHRLIEECMICANVAAAMVLSSNKYAGLYRIHDSPSNEKMELLRLALAPLGLRVPQAGSSPKAWAPLVEKIEGHPAAAQLLRCILQSQMQAKYDTGNIGHYGLALPLYSHFTSPIRRYADLITHRALLAAIKTTDAADVLPTAHTTSVAEHINLTERRSQHAEWEARDRLVARYFAALEGTTMEGTVVTIRPFGVFASLGGVAEGLIPARLLERDWHYHPRDNIWQHRASKKQLRLGTTLTVKLIEADWVNARLTLLPVIAAQTSDTTRPTRQKGTSKKRY